MYKKFSFIYQEDEQWPITNIAHKNYSGDSNQIYNSNICWVYWQFSNVLTIVFMYKNQKLLIKNGGFFNLLPPSLNNLLQNFIKITNF